MVARRVTAGSISGQTGRLEVSPSSSWADWPLTISESAMDPLTGPPGYDLFVRLKRLAEFQGRQDHLLEEDLALLGISRPAGDLWRSLLHDGKASRPCLVSPNPQSEVSPQV